MVSDCKKMLKRKMEKGKGLQSDASAVIRHCEQEEALGRGVPRAVTGMWLGPSSTRG